MNAPDAIRPAIDEADWALTPLPELLDFLARDHERIRGSMVPEVESALARALARDNPSPREESLAREWPAFALHLAAHMKEEETFLFPRLLHYDYCVGQGDSHPDFAGGSVNVFIAIHLMGNETRQMEALDRLLEGKDPRNAASMDAELVRALSAFRDHLIRHSRLETEVLFPRAKALEKSLYDAAISGKA